MSAFLVFVCKINSFSDWALKGFQPKLQVVQKQLSLDFSFSFILVCRERSTRAFYIVSSD